MYCVITLCPLSEPGQQWHTAAILYSSMNPTSGDAVCVCSNSRKFTLNCARKFAIYIFSNFSIFAHQLHKSALLYLTNSSWVVSSNTKTMYVYVVCVLIIQCILSFIFLSSSLRLASATMTFTIAVRKQLTFVNQNMIFYWNKSGNDWFGTPNCYICSRILIAMEWRQNEPTDWNCVRWVLHPIFIHVHIAGRWRLRWAEEQMNWDAKQFPPPPHTI